MEIVNKQDIVRKNVDGFHKPEVKISIWTLNGSQNQVLVVRELMSITKASQSVMILKSVLWYSLLITRLCFMRKETPPLAPVK